MSEQGRKSCGDVVELETAPGDPPEDTRCTLPAGHGVLHRDDDGTEWMWDEDMTTV